MNEHGHWMLLQWFICVLVSIAVGFYFGSSTSQTEKEVLPSSRELANVGSSSFDPDSLSSSLKHDFQDTFSTNFNLFKQEVLLKFQESTHQLHSLIESNKPTSVTHSDSDPCSPNPCRYGGRCIRTNKEPEQLYNCECVIGFEGVNCSLLASSVIMELNDFTNEYTPKEECTSSELLDIGMSTLRYYDDYMVGEIFGEQAMQKNWQSLYCRFRHFQRDEACQILTDRFGNQQGAFIILGDSLMRNFQQYLVQFLFEGDDQEKDRCFGKLSLEHGTFMRPVPLYSIQYPPGCWSQMCNGSFSIIYSSPPYISISSENPLHIPIQIPAFIKNVENYYNARNLYLFDLALHDWPRASAQESASTLHKANQYITTSFKVDDHTTSQTQPLLLWHPVHTLHLQAHRAKVPREHWLHNRYGVERRNQHIRRDLLQLQEEQPPALPWRFFNTGAMTENLPSNYTSDGLHYFEHVNIAKAQALLNFLRAFNREHPVDKCVSDAPNCRSIR